MTTIAAAPKCDARATGRAVTDWGFASLPCNTARGLRSFVDADGTTRFACAAPGHYADVERRYGHLPTVEPCRFCHRIEPILRGTYQRFVDPHVGIFIACDDCVEKADEPGDDDD